MGQISKNNAYHTRDYGRWLVQQWRMWRAGMMFSMEADLPYYRHGLCRVDAIPIDDKALVRGRLVYFYLAS